MKRKTILSLSTLLLLSGFAVPLNVTAAEWWQINWTCEAGLGIGVPSYLWSNTSCWSGGFLPQTDTEVTIAPSIGVDTLLIYDEPVPHDFDSLTIAPTISSDARLTLSVGTGYALSVGAEFDAGSNATRHLDINNGARLLQNGGDVTSAWLNVDGSYDLIDGSLTAVVAETIGKHGAGYFSQTGGANTISAVLVVGSSAEGSGNYSLGGGTLTSTVEKIGDDGTGNFRQTGGSNTISGELYLGFKAGDSGSYSLAGGSLTAAEEYVGALGIGIFSQSGGTNTASSWLAIGDSSSYTLTDGSLTVGQMLVIGNQGTGTFTQNGGYAITDNLDLGLFNGEQGTYNLNGGTLDSVVELVGTDGVGVFKHTGGDNNVSSALSIGGATINGVVSNQGVGTYDLSGGSLSASVQVIGNTNIGTFSQSGGINTASDQVIIGSDAGSQGFYNMSGGTLDAPSLFVGSYGTGYFGHIGGINEVETLILGNSRTGVGTYRLEGTGLIASPARLAADTEYIGFNGTGVFEHYGALDSIHTVGDLHLGYDSRGRGSYDLYGNVLLSAGNEYIGNDGIGVFTQLSGTNYITGNLFIGLNAGSNGSYTMNTGLGGTPELTSAIESVGAGGEGSFLQVGGINTTGILFVGRNAGGHGTYTQDGGSVTATNEYIGYAGTGAFTQNNGSNTVSNALYLGYDASGSGTYNLSGGGWLSSVLSAGAEVVGHDGNGIFNQSGGWNSVSTNLHVGSGSGTGEYNLSGGNLSASNENIGTGTGLGVFNQTGGDNNVQGTLTIGTNGIYNLDNASDAGYYIFLDTENIVNNGVINYSGGYVSLSARGDFCSYCGDDLNATTFENNGTLNISGEPAKTIDGNITNNGTVNAVNTNIRFNGTFTNNGEYFSDPSSSFFNDLIVNETGYLVGGTGDNFFLSGDFMNYSTQTAFWNTMDSYLGFTGINSHEFYLAGSDTASSMSFSWDTLELSDGGSLLFSGAAGASLYVDNLILSADSILNLNGFNLYYYSLTDHGGSYSGGELIRLASNDGGSSQVPEPSTILLLVGGIAGLAGFRRYYR